MRERSAGRSSWDSRQEESFLSTAVQKETRLTSGLIPSLSSALNYSKAANGHRNSLPSSPKAVQSTSPLRDSTFQYWSQRISRVLGQLMPLFRPDVPLSTLKSATIEAFDQVLALNPASEVALLQQQASSLQETQADLSTLNEDLLAELQDFTQANQQLLQLLTRLQQDKATLQRRLLDTKQAYHTLKSKANPSKHEDGTRIDDMEVACQTVERLPDDESEVNMLRAALQQAQQLSVSLQNELNRLNSLKETVQSSPSVRELAALRLKNETNLSLIVFLRRENESLKQHSSPISVAEGQIAALQSEIKQLRANCSEKSINIQSESDLEAGFNAIKRENATLKEENEALNREKVNLLELLAEFKAEQTSNLAETSSKRDKNRQPTEKILKQIADLELKLAEMTEERSILRNQMSYYENQADLMKEIADLKEENKELSQIVKANQAISLKNGNITSVEEAKEQLLLAEKELVSLRAANSEQIELKRRIGELEQDNEALKASCEDAERYVSTNEKRYLSQIEGLRMEINTKSALFRDQTIANTRKIQALKQELAKLKGANSTGI